VAQHLEIISKTFPTNQNSAHGIYDEYQVTNDESHENPGTPGTKLKDLRNNLKMLCHPICNWLYAALTCWYVGHEVKSHVKSSHTHERVGLCVCIYMYMYVCTWVMSHAAGSQWNIYLFTDVNASHTQSQVTSRVISHTWTRGSVCVCIYVYVYMYMYVCTWVMCMPMRPARRTWVTSPYEWVMSHIYASHVSNMNEPCHTYERFMSHIWTSHVPGGAPGAVKIRISISVTHESWVMSHESWIMSHSCVCICMCIYIHIYVYICMYIYMCIYIYIYTYACIYTYVHVYTYIYIFIYIR